MKGNGGIVIVGPCAAGKSTLATLLRQKGWPARQIAQEHSYVPTMWQQLSKPETLIYLDASFEVCSERKSLHWNREEYEEQVRRLAHARAHCDFYLATDELSPHQVLEETLEFLAGGHTQGQPV